MSSFTSLICIICLAGTLVISDTPAIAAKTTHAAGADAPGYSALKLFLEDEQYLTTIRRSKMLITFSGISDTSAKLVDEIADASEKAVEELEQLAREKPAFTFEEFSDKQIAIATLDSLRMTTAKEFLFNDSDFEKDLLISQLKVLRVISHLASRLEENETSSRRKKWLNKLARQYEEYYQQVYGKISVAKNS